MPILYKISELNEKEDPKYDRILQFKGIPKTEKWWERSCFSKTIAPPKTNMDTQNDGPWTRVIFKYGHFFGIYVRFLGGRTTHTNFKRQIVVSPPEPTLELFVAHALHTLLEKSGRRAYQLSTKFLATLSDSGRLGNGICQQPEGFKWSNPQIKCEKNLRSCGCKKNLAIDSRRQCMPT